MWSGAAVSLVAMQLDESLPIEAHSAAMPSIMPVRGETERAASPGPGKAGWAVMLLSGRVLVACRRAVQWDVRP
jgi:hypothetical protein